MHAPLVDEHVIILVKVGGVRGFHAVHIDFQVVAFVGSMYGYLCTRWELDVECIIEMRLDVVLVKHLLGRKQGEVLHGGHVQGVINYDEVLLGRVLRFDNQGANEGDGHLESTSGDHF